MEYEWDFAGGEAQYKKAFELDPSDATAHQWYAWDLAMIGGREQEAFTEINRAHQLDPLSPIIKQDVGFVHIRARQYDEAIFEYKKVANEDPTFAITHLNLAQAYWAKHMKTLQRLNTAYQERDLYLIGLKTDFQLEPLRSDPRFSEMVHKVGLPQ